MLPIRPERAIAASEEDRFSRGRFIAHIAGALITPSGESATGIVLGLTGDWGSGKTSILNLLRAHIQALHPDAVIVTFNPWLVSARDNLIADFFAALVDAISEKHANFPGPHDWKSQRAAEAIRSIQKYGADLSPLIDLAHPGVGTLGNFFFRTIGDQLEKLLSKRRGLLWRKNSMASALASMHIPVIVLVDELDRVDDNEVCVMAQLVRAIVDVEQISFVLAYDEVRVSEALGASALGHGERLKRGQRYLEKIVQLQIPVPKALDAEINAILTDDIVKVLAENRFAGDATTNERFLELKRLLIPGILATARDVKKASAAFSLRWPLVMGDVDWVDVLGFVALEMKIPSVARYARQFPDRMTFDGIDFAFFASTRNANMNFDQIFNAMCAEVEQSDWAKELTAFLFPALSRRRSMELCSREGISFRRGLITLLRLSVLPDAVSRQHLLDLIELNHWQLQANLEKAAHDGRLSDLIARLGEIYDDLRLDHRQFWRLVAGVIERMPTHQPAAELQRRTACDSVVDTYVAIAQKHRDLKTQTPALLFEVAESSDFVFAASLLRKEFFALGLFNRTARAPEKALMTPAVVSQLTDKLAEKMRQQRQKVIDERDAGVYFFLNDIGAWKDFSADFRQRLFASYDYLDWFVFALFGGHYGADGGTIEIFLPLHELETRVTMRLDQASFLSIDPLFRAAYVKLEDMVGWNLPSLRQQA